MPKIQSFVVPQESDQLVLDQLAFGFDLLESDSSADRFAFDQFASVQFGSAQFLETSDWKFAGLALDQWAPVLPGSEQREFDLSVASLDLKALNFD